MVRPSATSMRINSRSIESATALVIAAAYIRETRAMTIDIRRAGTRSSTQTGWLDSRHSFAFGQHYDPANTHHGLLVAHNDDVVRPGTGFDPHPHRDVEIITWVLGGSLVHEDSAGNCGVIYPGLAQRMSAGSGIQHSETNDSWRLTGGATHVEPARFVQMWVVPDGRGGPPGYQQRDVDAELRGGALVPIASGRPGEPASIAIGNRDATLFVARIEPGQVVTLPDAPFVHLFLARGQVALEDSGRLDEGDAVRFTAGGGQRVTAETSAEVLVWEMHATL